MNLDLFSKESALPEQSMDAEVHAVPAGWIASQPG